ncbi:alpha-N-acetylglucosaminidase C-terminal domain-containing protein [Kitasatospora sp. MAP12-44]
MVGVTRSRWPGRPGRSRWRGRRWGRCWTGWAAYFASLDRALSTRTDPAPIDWFALEDDWARSTTRYPVVPSGDPVALAREVATAVAG